MEEHPSYLIHYGTPGQKWGERNYQNPDGTYTELGKERRRKFFNVEKGQNVINKHGKGTGDYRVARGNVIKSRVGKSIGASIAGAAIYGVTSAALTVLNAPAGIAMIASGAAMAAYYGSMAYSTVQDVKLVGDIASVNMYDKVKRRENPNYNAENDARYGRRR